METELKGSVSGGSFGSDNSSRSSGGSGGGGCGCLLWFLVGGLISFVVCWAFLDMDPKLAAEYGLAGGTAVASLACFGPVCLVLGVVALLVGIYFALFRWASRSQ